MRESESGRTIQQLVEQHYVSLYRFAYRLSGSAQEAEDLTQETFCQAQFKLAQLRQWDRAKGWLFAILRNAFLRRRRSQRLENLVPLDLAEELPDRCEDPFPEVDSTLLQQALNEMPEAYRTPIVLYYFEEFSYRDIAEQMDSPIGTVMSRLARARSWLRTRLFQLTGLGTAHRGEDA